MLHEMGASILEIETSTFPRAHPLTNERTDWPRGLAKVLQPTDGSPGISLADGMTALDRIAETGVDLLIEDLGLQESFPQEWVRMRATNPGMTVVSISPFGPGGPDSRSVSSDLTLWARSGMAWTSPGMPDQVRDHPNEPPLSPTGVSAASIAGGTAAVTACLSALAFGDEIGREVTVSELDALISLNYDPINRSQHTRKVEPRGREFPGTNCYLPCADGWIVIGATNQAHWEALVDVMGGPDWAGAFDARDDRSANWDALMPLIVAWTTTQTGSDLTEQLQARGIGTHWATTLAEAAASEQPSSRGYFHEEEVDGKRISVPGIPFVLSQSDDLRDITDLSTSPAGTRSDRKLPLEGTRVLDFGQYIAAPFVGRWLAALGAEVILVESRLNPADFRAGAVGADGIPGPNRSPAFNVLAQGKKGLSLNMRTAEARAIARRLASQSDIVIENFSSGTMDRWGLGYPDLSELNPGLIYLSVAAWGRTGPLKDYAGLHSVINAFSGLADVTGYHDGGPRLLGSFFPDPFSGTCATWAVLAALRTRERTGRGVFVDFAMTEALATLTLEPQLAAAIGDEPPVRDGSHHPRFAPHSIFPSAGDDQWVAIAVRTDEEWRSLCRVIGRDDWLTDSAFGTPERRKARESDLDQAIGQWTATQSKEEAADLLLAAAVPAAPCLSPAEVAIDPHLDSRGSIVVVDHPAVGPRRYPSLPWRFDGAPIPPAGPAPLLHRYTAPILEELLGYSVDEIEELARNDVLT
jgi:crotonobetainyl-CoA:carnitine CoA-transferase CaiB-like acyl-CoA transferase